MINYTNLSTETALRLLQAYIDGKTETGTIHYQLQQILNKIKGSLNELKELKNDSGITFKIEGHKLVGVIDTCKKRQFRINND